MAHGAALLGTSHFCIKPLSLRGKCVQMHPGSHARTRVCLLAGACARRPYQAHDLWSGEQALIRGKGDAFRWHAVLAAEVAPLGQGDAEVRVDAAAGQAGSTPGRMRHCFGASAGHQPKFVPKSIPECTWAIR